MASGLSLRETLPPLKQSERAKKSMMPLGYANRQQRRRNQFGAKLRKGKLVVGMPGPAKGRK